MESSSLCKYCYAKDPCKFCGSLEFYELAVRRRLKSLSGEGWTFSMPSVESNIKNCEFCALLYAAAVAAGWDRRLGRLRGCQYDLRESLSLISSEQIYQTDYGLSPRLEFFTLEGNAKPTAIGRGRLIPNFFSQETKNQINSWAGAPQQNVLPKRVLDLHPSGYKGGLDEDIKVVETTAGQKDAYITLSHCWVGRQVLTTTRATLAERQDGIFYNSLSPIFRDAVRVSRFLGVRYLWIDSLCILQGDQDDWEDQANKMADIYSNAFFTIAVQHDDDKGFIYTPTVHELRQKTATSPAIYARETRRPNFLNQKGIFFERGGDNPRWIFARGWCYQERQLSQRILHFTDSEVFYESHNLVQCQCGNHSTVVSSAFGNPENSLQGWKAIVAEYTQHALTEKWDLLPGLAGIARRFQTTHNPGEYIAGLWRNNLAHWLCWKSVAQYTFSNMRGYCEDCRPWPIRLPPKPAAIGDDFITPSFSWAAKVGPCLFLNCIWERHYWQTVAVKDVKNVVDTRNPFGRFKQCQLTLSGFYRRFYIYSTQNKDRRFTSGCQREYAYICDEYLNDDICNAIIDDSEKGDIPPLQEAQEVEENEQEGVTEMEDERKSWFDLVNKQGTKYWFDAVDDLPSDGTEAFVLEIFRSTLDSSIGLVLQQVSARDTESESTGKRRKTQPLGTFRRVGLVFLDWKTFSTKAETIVLE